METFGEMKERLTDDLLVASSSSLFTSDRISNLINDAYMWAGGLYSWPQLERARDTTLPAVETSTDEQYFDYPEDFRTDTLTEFIYIDGKAFRRKAWNDFLEHKRLNPTSRKRIFADFGRQVFVFPHQTPGVEVCLWGQIQPTKLTADADTTIFSKHDDSGNEAIVRKAFATAMRRIDRELSQTEEKDAISLLSIVWKKIQDRQQYAQSLDKEMFRSFDYFANGSGMAIGNFSVNLDLEE